MMICCPLCRPASCNRNLAKLLSTASARIAYADEMWSRSPESSLVVRLWCTLLRGATAVVLRRTHDPKLAAPSPSAIRMDTLACFLVLLITADKSLGAWERIVKRNAAGCSGASLSPAAAQVTSMCIRAARSFASETDATPTPVQLDPPPWLV